MIEKLIAVNRELKALVDFALKAADKDYNAQDVKFVLAMIQHHQMAVEMSAKQSSKGKNEQIVNLAKAVSEAQKGEIAQMKKWLKDRSLKESGGDNMGM